MNELNTHLSNINELYTGFVLNGYKWFDSTARGTFERRCEEVPTEVYRDSVGRAIVMASVFKEWAYSRRYAATVAGVWWTARPGDLSRAVGFEVSSKTNPTDILVRFESGPANGFLGLSAKSTNSGRDIGFKNPGIGSLDKKLGVSLKDQYKHTLNHWVTALDLPKKGKDRKKFIRSSAEIQEKTREVGSGIMNGLRETLFQTLCSLDVDKARSHVISDWMNATPVNPPYIKVTGFGNGEPYSAKAEEPTNSSKLHAMMTNGVSFVKIGNESIGVMAGNSRVMKIRFKFESEPLASSMKLSGDPW